ncbi:hypothetical protein [Alcanivorax sp. DP30]|uniref:hypothetical protein n=1 Tax=Alcanivorax sp. DP30 TaxID=2606217 RepID=UPI00136CA1FE|nr:hypothetical protein [Alcanivorax sp. DP30]MZR61997.1 hypothetical protein [Alcanivorax sp. DP30]
MRLIGLLIALLAVGWLVMTQLQSTPPAAVTTVDQNGDTSTIRAPQNAEQLKTFEAQVNSLAEQQNSKSQEALEQIQ